ncbi:extracellular solute-binding protein, partial [Agrobacterium tumefaciens]|uniref:extracellular solute-binding protein n=1 Tax=Agrobacterium tumefaciens TaxID=358 RepID=UPI00157308A2
MGRLTTPLVFLTSLTLATLTSNAHATELHVSYSPANFSAMYEAISAEFTKENPDITIKFEPAQTYDELLQTTLRAEVIGTAPDVSHQGFNNLRVFADRGLAIPLDKFVAIESDWKDQGVAEAV